MIYKFKCACKLYYGIYINLYKQNPIICARHLFQFFFSREDAFYKMKYFRSYAERDKYAADMDKLREELERVQVW